MSQIVSDIVSCENQIHQFFHKQKISYIMLELARRVNKDPRTLGSLFHATCEELKQKGFVEALAILLTLFEQTLTAVMGISKELIRSISNRFLNELPLIYKARLLFLWENNLVPC